jgi:hypothetical protein
MIALRVGYKLATKDRCREGLSAGVGLMYDFGPVYAKVDYSYNHFGIFDAINRVQYRWDFKKE